MLSGKRIVLTADRSLMTNYRGNFLYGFIACGPYEVLPEWVFDKVFCPAVDCAGIPGGSAVEDECGVCGGDSFPCLPNGDINSDGEVNILDVVGLVNIVLGTASENPAGDLNQDGTYDILDIVLLINGILDT